MTHQRNSNRKHQDGAPTKTGNDDDNDSDLRLNEYKQQSQRRYDHPGRNQVSKKDDFSIKYRINWKQFEKSNSFQPPYQELNPNAREFQPANSNDAGLRRTSYELQEKRQRNYKQEEEDASTNEFLQNMLTSFDALADEARKEWERMVDEFNLRIKEQQKLIRQCMAKLVVNRAHESNPQPPSRIVISRVTDDDSEHRIEQYKPPRHSESTHTNRNTTNKPQEAVLQEGEKRESALDIIRRCDHNKERRLDEQECQQQEEEECRRQNSDKEISENLNQPHPDVFVEPHPPKKRQDQYPDHGRWERSCSRESSRSRDSNEGDSYTRFRSTSFCERNPKQQMQNLKFGKFPTLLKSDGDYLLFTHRVKSKLKAKGSLHVVDRRIEPPKDWNREELMELDAAVRIFIASNIDDKVYQQARTAGTSIDLLGQLEQIVDPSGSATIYGLHE